MKRLTLKALKPQLDQLILDIQHHTPRLFSVEQRLASLERLLRGGIKGHEGLFFRVTQLEQLIKMKDHVKPVTKKQMNVIRKMPWERVDEMSLTWEELDEILRKVWCQPKVKNGLIPVTPKIISMIKKVIKEKGER